MQLESISPKVLNPKIPKHSLSRVVKGVLLTDAASISGIEGLGFRVSGGEECFRFMFRGVYPHLHAENLALRPPQMGTVSMVQHGSLHK